MQKYEEVPKSTQKYPDMLKKEIKLMRFGICSTSVMPKGGAVVHMDRLAMPMHK